MDLLVTIVGLLIIIYSIRAFFKHRARAKIIRLFEKAGVELSSAFSFSPCPRCDELVLQINGLSPNARSANFRCDHCGKKGYAKAKDSDKAFRIAAQWHTAERLVGRYNQKNPQNPLNVEAQIEADAPERSAMASA